MTDAELEEARRIAASAPERISQALGHGAKTESEMFYSAARQLVPRLIAALESARRERDAAEAARMTAVRREYSIGDRVTSLAVELFGSDSFDEDDCEDGAIEAIRTETRRLTAERDTARAEAGRLRSERGTVVVDGLTYGEHMTRDLRAQLAQRDRDWDALVKLIATTVGTEEDRDCAENDELAEFDPWHALRTRAAEAEQLRAERDAAAPILDATYRWHDADKILDGENEDNANSREMFNARRNRWKSIESLRAALDAWRTTKGDAGK